MEDVVNPWRGRRVYLTGHTGFKGSWLALWLAGRGAIVHGFSLDPDSEDTLFTAARVAELIEDERGDIRDEARLAASLAAFRPEVVFHLAAQPLVRRSYAEPIATYATNVMGTAHLLEAVRKSPGVRAVVCVTTDKCYQNQEWVWPYRETDALGGHDPYASSKACAELVAAAWRSSYFPADQLGQHGVALATARAGNVIGGGDWSEDRLIPDLVRGFRQGEPVLIRSPYAIRPWQHVLDPVHGYILLAERLLAGQAEFASAFNFGPADEDCWPVEAIANRAAALWGASDSGAPRWRSDAAPGPHETRTLRIDASKARATLGWTPRLRIEAALEWTLHWYKAWAGGADMRKETEAQIDAYRQIAP